MNCDARVRVAPRNIQRIWIATSGIRNLWLRRSSSQADFVPRSIGILQMFSYVYELRAQIQMAHLIFENNDK